MSDAYDKSYDSTAALFGTEPESTLCRYCNKISHELPVLDIGAGQGRNSCYLASRGFVVDAIDPSSVAVETIAAAAQKDDLPIRSVHCCYDTYVPTSLPYGAVLVFGLIQILTHGQINILMSRVRQWTGDGSLLFVTAFSVEDPSYRYYASHAKLLGQNSFQTDDGEVRTFLEPNEILRTCADWQVVHHWEGQGPEHCHGEGTPERHAMIELVARRR
ncbi:MAG: methyltransferase domain-containing protein [Candidatus Zixiibacteriota bacterium]